MNFKTTLEWKWITPCNQPCSHSLTPWPFFFSLGNYTCEVEWPGSPLELTHLLQVSFKCCMSRKSCPFLYSDCLMLVYKRLLEHRVKRIDQRCQDMFTHVYFKLILLQPPPPPSPTFSRNDIFPSAFSCFPSFFPSYFYENIE